MGPIVYRPSPGFEHNAWVVRVLLNHHCLPECWFPFRNGLNPRFFVWRFVRDGKTYEHSTTHGRLGEYDVAVMLWAAGEQMTDAEREMARAAAKVELTTKRRDEHENATF